MFHLPQLTLTDVWGSIIPARVRRERRTERARGMSRFAAAALLLPTVVAVLSEDGSRQCPDGCNGHGRCWFWLHERTPALCISATS